MKTAAKHPTLTTCLEMIRKGDVSAVGVLADYLEEHRLPNAKTVRSLWNRFNRYVTFWSDPNNDVSRRKWTRWEGVARNRRWLRRRIGEVYCRQWKQMPLDKFK
jgi:hypothetical protein